MHHPITVDRHRPCRSPWVLEVAVVRREEDEAPLFVLIGRCGGALRVRTSSEDDMIFTGATEEDAMIRLVKVQLTLLLVLVNVFIFVVPILVASFVRPFRSLLSHTHTHTHTHLLTLYVPFFRNLNL